MKLKAIKAFILDADGRMITDYFLSDMTAQQFCTHHGLELFKTEVVYIEQAEVGV